MNSRLLLGNWISNWTVLELALGMYGVILANCGIVVEGVILLLLHPQISLLNAFSSAQCAHFIIFLVASWTQFSGSLSHHKFLILPILRSVSYRNQRIYGVRVQSPKCSLIYLLSLVVRIGGRERVLVVYLSSRLELDFSIFIAVAFNCVLTWHRAAHRNLVWIHWAHNLLVRATKASWHEFSSQHSMTKSRRFNSRRLKVLENFSFSAYLRWSQSGSDLC